MRALDDKDETLLQLLREDSRTPLKSLGAVVGLSTSTVQERLARLKRDGAIAAFTIREPEASGRSHAYMLVTTESQSCADVAPHLLPIPEIVRCDSLAGDIDMVLLVEARSPERLQAVRDQIAVVSGVRDVVTLPRMTGRFAR
jgi:DNA-binding Lrp family transcriptional regulator